MYYMIMIERKEESEKMSEVKRPLAISIVAIFAFFLGVSGAILVLIELGAISQLSRVGVSLPFIGVLLYVLISGLVIFPLLALAGYNLWRMRKWAAKLAVIIFLFDLVTAPFINLLPPFSLDAGDVVAMALNILCLIGIASAWKEYN